MALARLGQAGELRRRHSIDVPHEGDGCCSQGLHLTLKAGRQEPVDPGQSGQRGALDTRDRHPGRDPEEHGDGHSLVLVEQQRRHVRPHTQAITAGRARRAVNAVAEVADAFHVPADGASFDPEPVGQFLAGPRGPALKQCQQPQETPRGIRHIFDFVRC